MISELARRLGIESERVVRKAQEYERLIQLKASAASKFHVKGVGQIIICLDLAAEAENVEIDKSQSLKLSGLKKPLYNSTKQTLKQLLGINNELSTKDICVQFGCPEMVTEVENLVEMYRLESCNGRSDIDHPGFKAAAIMTISKLRKLRMEKSRLHELSGLKKTVFDKLVASMTAIQQQHDKQNSSSKPKATKRSYNFMEAVEAKAKALDEEADKDVEHEKEVDFEEWKRRMLAEAE